MTKQTDRELHWHEVIGRQEASGETAASWCRQRDIPVQTLYWWRSELRRRGRPAEPREAPAFLAVRVVPEVQDHTGEPLRLLAGGREIVIEGDFDERVLAKLILLVEGMPC